MVRYVQLCSTPIDTIPHINTGHAPMLRKFSLLETSTRQARLLFPGFSPFLTILFHSCPHRPPGSYFVQFIFHPHHVQWSSSVCLIRKVDKFEALVSTPWRDKIAYKFVVDGHWLANPLEPIEADQGFVKNIYILPPKLPQLDFTISVR